MVLDQAALLSSDPKVRFAALLHDLGKGTTPRADWPSHRGHEQRSVELIEKLCGRLRVPGDYRDLSVIVARYHGNAHRAFELRPDTILDMLEKADAFRRPERFAQALLACEADSRGRLGLEQTPYPQRQYLHAAQAAAAAVKPGSAELAQLNGPEIAAWLRAGRLQAVTAVRDGNARPL